MLDPVPIPAFSDNYIWLLQSGRQSRAWVVDPGDAGPVRTYLEKSGLELAGILITHHHYDHTGGIAALLSDRSVPVYGPSNPQIDGITERLGEGQRIELADDLHFDIFSVPGHTLDHIAYYSSDACGGEGLLLAGDTLFAGGCGRLFEGTAEMMYDSLQKLASLPGSTRVCCAHEYTLANLEFALATEPHSRTLKQRYEAESRKRSDGVPTLPSTIERELASNPFLRCAQPELVREVEKYCGKPLTGEARVFAELRRWKDNF